MVYIKQLEAHAGESVTLHGWVYNYRTSKNLVFIELRDGTGLCQAVVSKNDIPDDEWEKANILKQESSVALTGKVVEDERSVGGYELHVTRINIYQIAEDYPITPKEHGIEFLMENRHLWLRSQKQWAAMRIRNAIIYAIHTFFQQHDFVQMDAPIFTGNAAEGTTTLFETDYFDEKAYLTQSGQLYAEAMAMAHGKVYTFGPTFRAEKSKTRRHLTEFWMIEPEMAFYDLNMNMELAENFIRFIVKKVLSECENELNILERDRSKLEKTAENAFKKMSYTEAVELLKSNETLSMLEELQTKEQDEKKELKQEDEALKKEFGQAKKWRKTQIEARRKEILGRLGQIEENERNIPVWKESAANFTWGEDFGGSDETLLTMHFNTPVIIHRYPAAVKAFYMKRDEKNNKLALAMDVLAPEGYGEIVGGSERESDLNELQKKIEEHNLPEEAFKWYTDLRRYGTVPHSGFGLGLERTVAWLCGINHVRETIPFPRMLGRLKP